MFFATTALIALQAATPNAPPTPPPPPPCASEAHAGFDFWVGEWDVYPNGQEAKVGESRIERKHNGCAVIENWMPLSGQSGTSLNHYDVSGGVWRQKWVGSAAGGAVEFTGGVSDGKMILTGNWPSAQSPHTLVRMTYTKSEDGSVRQFGEASTDHGVSWQTAFDFIYRPKKAAPE